MSAILDTVLLVALPASGKSEVRRYLRLLSPEVCRKDFHLGPTVQLDDFPYVHLMRRIDDELAASGAVRVFFQAGDQPFLDSRDWGTLIHLLNDDHADLVARRVLTTDSYAAELFRRIDAAGEKSGIPPRLAPLGEALTGLGATLEEEARALRLEQEAAYPDSLEGRTLVIEFARGGPDGSSLPLPAPHGYAYSFSQLAPEILERAAVLYIWVTPEESRRKNEARTDPDDPGSILHHGVPLSVMLGEYGCDDMDWLVAQARTPGTVPVTAHGKEYALPVARFDNRVDRTSFVREEPEAWDADAVRALHEGLRDGLQALYKSWSAGG